MWEKREESCLPRLSYIAAARIDESRICLVVCIGLRAATFTFSLAILTLRIPHGSYDCNRGYEVSVSVVLVEFREHEHWTLE
jgi:hypothetical protein